MPAGSEVLYLMVDHGGADLVFDAWIESSVRLSGATSTIEVSWKSLSAPFKGRGSQSPPVDGLTGSWEITGIPRNGPVEIFRRRLSVLDDRSALRHPRSTVWRDARVEPMDDEQFWSLVDLLGGSGKTRSVAKLETKLRSLGSDEASRFAVALHLRLYELDHPAHALSRSGGGLEYVSDDVSQDLRAAIIAKGRSAYLQAIAEPGSVSTAPGGAEPLIYAANRALSSDSEMVLLDTGIDFSTGSNLEHWPDIDRRPPPPARTEDDRKREWQREILSWASVLGEVVTPEDPWYDVSRQSSWYATLWVTETRGRLYESLTVFTRPMHRMGPDAQLKSADEQPVRDLVVERLLEADEVLVGPIDLEVCGRPLRRREIAELTLTE